MSSEDGSALIQGRGWFWKGWVHGRFMGPATWSSAEVSEKVSSTICKTLEKDSTSTGLQLRRLLVHNSLGAESERRTSIL